jgi:hypothetical protein
MAASLPPTVLQAAKAPQQIVGWLFDMTLCSEAAA